MKIFECLTTVYQMLVTDPDFIVMRQEVRKEFDDTYHNAFEKYIEGDWQEAYDLLTKCLEMNPNDGPSKTLRYYIESLNKTSPEDWDGYRLLTYK